MQLITPARRAPGAPDRSRIAVGLGLAFLFLTIAGALVWLIIGTPLLNGLVPNGRASTGQLVAGAVVWTLALVAPAGLGLLGLIRLIGAIEGMAARARSVTPALRVRQALGPEYSVALGVWIPNAARRAEEVVIGPFGVAVLAELPPAKLTRVNGRAWDVRHGGRWVSIDNPIERAARDAEAFRRWFDLEETDHVVKVYAAVVGEVPGVERTSDCAVIAPDQVAPWLRALPVQRGLTPERTTRVVDGIRKAAG